MKKIAILSALFCAMTAVQAENVVEVVPFSAAAGVVSDDGATFDLTLTNETCQAGILVFDMYLPAGLDLDLSYDVDGAENTAIEIIKDRTKYKEGRSEKETGHNGAYNFIGLEDGFNHYRVVISSAGDVPLQGTSGAVARFYYVTDAGMADGVYPIYVRAAELTNVKAMTMETFEAATSYVTIGSPVNVSTLAVEGILPSFVNASLVDEAGIATLDLSKVTESNGTFTYVDGRNVIAPTAEVHSDVVYKRAAGANTYASLKLPFAADVNCLKFVNVVGTTANFAEATAVAAGESVIVEGAVNVEATDVVLGSAEESTATEGQFYLKNDKFYSVNVSANVPAFRGVWDMDVAASNLRIAVDGVLTGIDAAQIDAQGNTFDIQGRQVQNTKNGVFVVNGKKQFVK